VHHDDDDVVGGTRLLHGGEELHGGVVDDVLAGRCHTEAVRGGHPLRIGDHLAHPEDGHPHATDDAMDGFDRRREVVTCADRLDAGIAQRADGVVEAHLPEIERVVVGQADDVDTCSAHTIGQFAT
jgi:hypothetical protein